MTDEDGTGPSEADAPPPDTSEAATLDPCLVGAAVRDARVAAGLSMGELARRSGVSQPYISQVEHGKFSPSLTTLYRLAGALGVPTSSLVPPMAAFPEEGLHRHGRGTPVTMADAPGSPVGHMLSRGGASQLEAFVYELDPGSVDHGTEFSHPGEEFQFVLDGRVLVGLDGEPPIELAAGDSLHFDAMRPHVWTVPGPEPARVLLVVAYPTRPTQ